MCLGQIPCLQILAELLKLTLNLLKFVLRALRGVRLKQATTGNRCNGHAALLVTKTVTFLRASSSSRHRISTNGAERFSIEAVASPKWRPPTEEAKSIVFVCAEPSLTIVVASARQNCPVGGNHDGKICRQ